MGLLPPVGADPEVLLHFSASTVARIGCLDVELIASNARGADYAYGSGGSCTSGAAVECAAAGGGDGAVVPHRFQPGSRRVVARPAGSTGDCRSAAGCPVDLGVAVAR